MDERIVYGARCTWWGSIREVGKTARGLPCCPHCGGVLFEVDDIATWDGNVAQHTERSGDARYPAFIAWLRGRCLPDAALARAQFDQLQE